MKNGLTVIGAVMIAIVIALVVVFSDRERYMPGENMLKYESSPYLLQHAGNPVHWKAWSDKAFEQAVKEDKPVFLSIGYSTCHWCHVMEEESFENKDVADILNRSFVSIKVDREERPDVDQVFMETCIAFNGHGGWPLTIILTPDGKPFFAGTYLPREGYGGRMGLVDLLTTVENLWENDRQKLIATGNQVVHELDNDKTGSRDDLTPESFKRTYEFLSRRFDSIHGGFGTKPKFPSPHDLLFLIQYGYRENNKHAWVMVEKTLQSMFLGGLFDHVGYGFHRYSTDRKWHLPHFEKMLYDQAMLILAYTRAYQLTGEDSYRLITLKIFQYLEERMKNQAGGYYSAEDADSEGEEGLYYTWTWKELEKLLTPDELQFMVDNFQVKKDGNYDDEASGKPSGRNILHPSGDVSLILSEKWNNIRVKLKRSRDDRIPPQKDDKILTDWNGLVIYSLAEAAGAFKDENLLKRARETETFISDKMIGDNYTLFHRYRKGKAGIEGKLDDYAFLIRGLLALYRQTGDTNYLQKADNLMTIANELFWDKNGFYYLSSQTGDNLFKRPIVLYDSAIPAGNSIQVGNLMELSVLTGNNNYRELALKATRNISSLQHKNPGAFSMFMHDSFTVSSGLREIVIAGYNSDDFNNVLSAIRSHYLPGSVIVANLFDKFNKLKNPSKLLPATISGKVVLDNEVTIYVCKDFMCKQPVKTVESALETINSR